MTVLQTQVFKLIDLWDQELLILKRNNLTIKTLLDHIAKKYIYSTIFLSSIQQGIDLKLLKINY